VYTAIGKQIITTTILVTDRRPDFIGALETLKLAALTRDIRPHGNTFRRTAYIALYKIDNVRIEGENLRFEFIEKMALLRRGH
jgi:hypothetical protein